MAEGKNDVENLIVLADDVKDEKEAEGFRQNCEYVRNFLKNIKTRQSVGMSEDMLQDLNEIKGDLREFVQEHHEGCKPKTKSAESGDLKNSRVVEKHNRHGKFSDIYDDLSDERSDQVSSDSGSSSSEAGEYPNKGKYKVKSSERKNGKVSQMRFKSRAAEKGKEESLQRDTKRRSLSGSQTSNESQVSMNGREENQAPPNNKDAQVKSSYIDYREAPRLEKFREESGQNLRRYLMKFEEYCRLNFRGSKEFWLNVLEDKLEGRIQESFKILRDPNDDYHETIEVFLDWYKDSADNRKRRYRRKFAEAKPKRDEGLHMFSIRLASIFRTAYPKHEVNKSKLLIKQFKKVIPRRSRESLNTQLTACRLKNKKPDWNFVQQCVRFQEGDDERDSRSDSEEEVKVRRPKEVVINLSNKSQDNRRSRFDNHQDNRREYIQRDQSHSHLANRRSRDQSRGNYNRCFKCDKVGHEARNCWRALGLCLICGEDGHFVNECPRNNFVKDQSRQMSRGRSNSNSSRNWTQPQQNSWPNERGRTRRPSGSGRNGQGDYSTGRNGTGRESHPNYYGRRNSWNNSESNANYHPVAERSSTNPQQVSLGQSEMRGDAVEFQPRAASTNQLQPKLNW